MGQDQGTTQAIDGQASIWPRCAASAAVFRGEQVLLIERGKGTLQGFLEPAGRAIEAGEAARAAAVREVREETGVAAELSVSSTSTRSIRHRREGALAAHNLIAVFWGVRSQASRWRQRRGRRAVRPPRRPGMPIGSPTVRWP